jgi:hypothetical protein
MRYPKQRIINVLHDAAVSLGHDLPEYFRTPNGRLSAPALRDHMMLTAGVTNNEIKPQDQEVAYYFELLEAPEKIDLLDEALSIY